MARPAAAGARFRNEARLIKGERVVARAVEAAMIRLTAYSIAALEQSGLDPATLDPQAKPWRDALSGDVTPALEAVFGTAWDAIAAGGLDLDPGPYATRHIESVWSRLVGTSDDVFDSIRLELAAGRQAGESIAKLAQRINLHLTDADQWAGRARTIARTETIGANNAGARGAARATAEYLGVQPEDVQRTWMATDDERTRETHADADGQVIFGMDSTYTVGDAELEGPADPNGPPEEVVNCRCTETYSYPGDPDYEGVAVAAAAVRGRTMRTATRRPIVAAGGPDEDPSTDDAQTGVVVVALPAASDAVQSIGDEQKHATMLYFGDVAGGGNPNELLTDDFRSTLEQAVATYAAGQDSNEETVTGVDSLGDDGARVWMLEGNALPGWRTELLDTDSELSGPLEAVEQFPTYTPHVTIGYPAEGEETLEDATEAAAVDVTSIRFDRLAVWWAGEQTEYTLGEPSATDEEQDMDPDDTATTAGGTLLASVRGRIPAEQIEQIARTLGRPVEQVAAALSAALVRPVAAAAGDPAPVATDTEELDAGDPAPVAIEGMDADGDGMPDGWDKFWGVCVQENSQTGDGRVFAAEALYWGELPIPAGWQPQDAMGHDDAITMGRLDTLARVGDLIAYTGTYDMDGAGWEVQRLVEGGFLRGPSVDVDDCEAELLMPDGTPVDPFDMMFEGGDEDPILTVTKGRIRSMVVCRVPAMEGTQAFICNGLPVGDGTKRPTEMDAAAPPAEEEAADAIAAAASRIDVAPLPDATWFSDPALEQPTPMTVTADGRIFGHLAEWGVCHIGLDGVCTEPPPSFSDYAYFAVGTVLCAGGELVNVGQITMDTGHASLSQAWRPAAAHYDNTGAVVADIAVGQDGHGIWMAGKVRDNVAPEKVAALRAAGKVSGDWREVRRGSGDLELVAALAVNVPGFPIPRVQVGLAASGQTALVAAGIVPTVVERQLLASGVRPFTVGDPSFREIVASAVTDELAARDRRGRIEEASGRIRGHRVARAAARIGSRS